MKMRKIRMRICWTYKGNHILSSYKAVISSTESAVRFFLQKEQCPHWFSWRKGQESPRHDKLYTIRSGWWPEEETDRGKGKIIIRSVSVYTHFVRLGLLIWAVFPNYENWDQERRDSWPSGCTFEKSERQDLPYKRQWRWYHYQSFRNNSVITCTYLLCLGQN